MTITDATAMPAHDKLARAIYANDAECEKLGFSPDNDARYDVLCGFHGCIPPREATGIEVEAGGAF